VGYSFPMASDAQWRKAEAAYLNGEGSLRAIAEKFGISSAAIMKRSVADKWLEKKKQINSSIKAEVAKEIAKGGAIKEFDAIAKIDKLIERMDTAMDDAKLAHKLSEFASVTLKLILSREELTPKAIATDDDEWG
jgi:hypothetical protein